MSTTRTAQYDETTQPNQVNHAPLPTYNEQTYSLIFGDINCRLNDLESDAGYHDRKIDELDVFTDGLDDKLELLVKSLDDKLELLEKRIYKLEKLEAWYAIGHKVFAEGK